MRRLVHTFRSVLASGFALACAAYATAQTPVFRATTNLQSIAVQAVDRKGTAVAGLTAADFTLLEDGRPQKIAFFGAQGQPVSLAVLLDSSRSMDFGRKFDRARELLAPLMAGHRADDQILFLPFTDRVEAFRQLTAEERLHPVPVPVSPKAGEETKRGTALYDALASALCRMRSAEHPGKTIVAITDGADQHSRLNLEQLIGLARTSSAQIFMIGLFSRPELRVFRVSDKTVRLVSEHEIDNPVMVFDRLAKESGAKSFFPSSEAELKAALDRISEMLQAQYTLAWYPEDADRMRRIEVRVRRPGIRVTTRQSVGSSSASGPVRFEASSCEVSALDHPLPWEPKMTLAPSGGREYREDFSDAKSGWPNRRERTVLPRERREYLPGLHYVDGGYEISRHAPSNFRSDSLVVDGTVAAYGPSFGNVRESVSVYTEWTRIFGEQHGNGILSYVEGTPGNGLEAAAGLVFHLNENGYYALALTGAKPGGGLRGVQFKLARWLFNDDGPTRYADLIPWTPVQSSLVDSALPVTQATDTHTVSVEYREGEIAVEVDGHPQAIVHDEQLREGLAGMAVFGRGDAMFHDLRAEEVH